jgi:hypothetical protein
MSQPHEEQHEEQPAVTGAWRDERELPLADLTEAMAVYSTDGQQDDPTGNDAGAEEEFGDEPFALKADGRDGDPDPDSEEGRALRPSPEGRSGPN